MRTVDHNNHDHPLAGPNAVNSLARRFDARNELAAYGLSYDPDDYSDSVLNPGHFKFDAEGVSNGL